MFVFNGRKLKSSVYLTMFSSKETILNHVSNCIKKETIDSFICMSSLESFSSSLGEDEFSNFSIDLSKYCENVFFNGHSSFDSVLKLYLEINRLRLKSNSSIIIVISNEVLTKNHKQDEINFIEYIKRFSLDKKITVNLFIYGRDVNLIKKHISQRPDLCIGYSSLQSIDTKSYVHHVYYWGLDTGMQGESETYFTLNEERAFVIQPKKCEQQSIDYLNIDDESTIYISMQAIENNNKILDTMICTSTNEELVQHLNGISRATIVFSCSKQSEVRQLGVNIYQLRQRFGKNIKIVVREMKSCLRYSDEMYLLQSGINLIVHIGTRFSSMLNAIEILRGQILTRSLPSTTEELLNFSFETTETKGYINNEFFVNYIKETLKNNDVVKTEYALIKLELLPNIKPHSYLSMCNIKREGDVMTVCQGAIYLFLQGIRMSDLPIALNHIFSLPVRDIFLSQISFTTIGRVENELPNVLYQSINIDEELTLTDNGTFVSSDSSTQLILAQHKPLEF